MKFLRKVAKQDLEVDLPEPGRFAAGLVFLPQDAAGAGSFANRRLND